MEAQTANKPAFVPSKYQEDIFRWVLEGRGDAMVNAVAGAGKTTTAERVGGLITSHNSVFLAFNKHIAEELQMRFQRSGSPMQARTIHSLGYAICAKEFGRLKAKEDKYRWICRDVIHDRLADYLDDVPLLHRESTEKRWAEVLEKLVDLARCYLVDKSPNDVFVLAEQAAIDPGNAPMIKMCHLVEVACREGVRQAERGGVVDFTDMVWLPNALELPCPPFDWIIVDECQDLNAAQRELVLRCRKPGGRMLFVGDPNQAIMGFAGADYRSYMTIRDRTSATQLPLSICYRCPSSHIELAQQIVPEIEAAPDAIEGLIDTIGDASLVSMVQEGDLVICRKNAPLVRWCIRMIRARIPARVRGRDVAKTLITALRKIGDDLGGQWNWPQFPLALENYQAKETERLMRRSNPESLLMLLDDTVEAIQACYEEFEPASLEDLCSQIEGIFSDAQASVWLSSVHRAKGLEAERVFILYPQYLPLAWSNQTDDQFRQEMNLRYVALTRAKDSLFFVAEGSVGHEIREEEDADEEEVILL